MYRAFLKNSDGVGGQRHSPAALELKLMVKVKVTLEQVTKAQTGSRCISTLSLTSALDGEGGQRHSPADLHPGKFRYPLYRRLGWSQVQSGRVRKISPPTGFDPQTVQALASRYTDCAIRTHNVCPHNVFSYIETGLVVVMHKECYVMSLEGKRTDLSFFSREG
jgi:hypothetical protein